MSYELINDVQNYDPHERLDVEISLYDKHINSHEANQIVGIMNGRRVTRLSILSSKISEDALTILARAIGAYQSELKVSFFDSDLNDKDAIILSEGLRNKMVSWLDLSVNKIGDEGAIALAKAHSINPSAVLELHRNQIGPTGGEALARSHCLDSDSFFLTNNLLGDEGAAKIAKVLAENPNIISSLEIQNNGIGLEGDLALAENLPSSVREVIYQEDKPGLINTRKHAPDPLYEFIAPSSSLKPFPFKISSLMYESSAGSEIHMSTGSATITFSKNSAGTLSLVESDTFEGVNVNEISWAQEIK